MNTSRISNLKRVLLMVAVFSLALSGAAAPKSLATTSERGIDVGVAAYVWPNDPYIQDLIDPVKTPTPPATVVVNIGNGEGDVAVMDDAADAIRARIAANGEHVKVVGYVYSQLAQRDIAAVKADIDRWLEPRNGTVHYNGIFVDETTRTCGATQGTMEYRDYYRALREHVWNKLPNQEDLVINNPGTAVEDCMLDSAHRTADMYVTFEGSATSYAQIASAATNWAGYTGGNVFNTSTGYHVGTEYDSDSFWHMVYDAPAADMNAIVTSAYNRYAGNIEVTDDYMTQTWLNPWNGKPTYLSETMTYARTLPLN